MSSTVTLDRGEGGVLVASNGWRLRFGEWEHGERVWSLVFRGECSQCNRRGPVVEVGRDVPYESCSYRLCATCLTLAMADVAEVAAMDAAVGQLYLAEEQEP